MEKVRIGKKYYLFSDKEYDKIVQDYLLAHPDKSILDSSQDIITYFLDNYIDILNDMFIEADEDTNVKELLKGLKSYLYYINKK